MATLYIVTLVAALRDFSGNPKRDPRLDNHPSVPLLLVIFWGTWGNSKSTKNLYMPYHVPIIP